MNPTDQDNAQAEEAGRDGVRVAGGPLGILLPTDIGVWKEARRMVSEPSSRVEDLATCCAQDPAIVLDLLRIANAMYFSAGRPPITTTRQAIQRLGSDVVIDGLEKLKDRVQITDEDISHWLEVHRSRCRRTSIVAKIVAEATAKTLSDDCQTVALVMNIGELLAVVYFGERYVKLAEEHSRGTINFRLAQDFKFDPDNVGLAYLRRNGIPEALLFALDREARPKSPERAVMRPICGAASEMVDAFDADRWEKLAPGKKLSPMSALRILQLSDSQYLKLYERVSEFLFAMRIHEEKKKQASILPGSEVAKAARETNIVVAPEASLSPDQLELDADIRSLLSGGTSTPIPEEPRRQGQAKDLKKYNLTPSADTNKKAARSEIVVQVAPPPQMRSANSNAFVGEVCNIIDKAKSSEELLSDILAMLVGDGPFKRSALIVVSKERDSALVVVARGPNMSNGQTIAIDDPLSPLAQCFSKVQSFGSNKNKVSPWGSRAFAVAPVDADHDTPVALYADCGDDNSITFEARRVFRNVVEILNQKLPQLPGGIPVEVRE